MPGLITEHLVRRGVEVAHGCYSKIPAMTPERGDEVANELAARFSKTSSIVTLVSIFVTFFVSSFMIEYAIRFLATTLAIVEDNEGSAPAAVILTVGEPDAPLEKKGLMEDVDGINAQEDILVLERPFQPVTRKLRTTLKHLKQAGGFKNIFRGMRHAAAYGVGMVVFVMLFRAGSMVLLGPGSLFGIWAAHALAAIAGCNLHATWTHAMIAERHESTSFSDSYLDKSEARKLILPTLRLRVAIGVMQALFLSTLPTRQHLEKSTAHGALMSLTFPVVGALIVSLGLVLPAYIALIRCEASLLPENATPIVPFDRTFNGKLVNAEEVAAERGVCAGRIRFRQFATFRGAFELVDRKVYKRVLVRTIQYVALSAFVTACFAFVFVSAGVRIAGGCQKVMEALMYARAIIKEEFDARA